MFTDNDEKERTHSKLPTWVYSRTKSIIIHRHDQWVSETPLDNGGSYKLPWPQLVTGRDIELNYVIAVTRMLCHAAMMIDSPPRRSRGVVVANGKPLTMIYPTVCGYTKGKRTRPHSVRSTRNLVFIDDDLVAETNEGVKMLFTKKGITRTRPCCISYRSSFQRTN